MPSVLISNEGGVTRVAPFEAPPEAMVDAVEFPDAEQAVTAAVELLNEGAGPADPAAPPADPTAAQAPGQGEGEIDALMAEGFKRAKQGRG